MGDERMAMAGLLQAGPASMRISSVVRAWLALGQQKRRRGERGGAVEASLPVPVITEGGYMWDQTEPGWADVTLFWTADTSGVPNGQFEVWCESDGMAERLLATLPWSDRVFEHTQATADEGSLLYRVRYRIGESVGGFSNQYAVVVWV